MDLSVALRLVRRWAVVLIGATLIAALIGLVVAGIQRDRYTAEVQLLVGPTAADFQTLRAAADLAETYAELAVGTSVLENAAAEIDTSLDPEAFREVVAARANELTRILTVGVTDTDPRKAAGLANSLASALIEVAASNAPEAAEGEASTNAGSLRVVEAARAPEQPTTPGPAVVVPLAAVAGLATALLAAVSIEMLLDHVREPAEVEEIAGVGCVGIEVGTPSIGLGWRKTGAPPRDAYRPVIDALEARDVPKVARSIAVLPTSAEGTEAHAALAIAQSFTDAGSKVVVVDVCPDAVLTKRLDVQNAPDLGDYLATSENTAILLQALRRSDQAGVMILARGPRGKAPELLDEPGKVLQLILNEVDRVVVLTGPPGRYGDGLAWARSTDSVLLAVTAEKTRKRDVAEAVHSSKVAGVRLTAAILHR